MPAGKNKPRVAKVPRLPSKKRGRGGLGQCVPGVSNSILFGAENWSNNCPNLAKKVVLFLMFFLFLKILEFFRCLLAIFLAIPRLSWTALDPENLKKTCYFFEVFVNAAFLALVRS